MVPDKCRPKHMLCAALLGFGIIAHLGVVFSFFPNKLGTRNQALALHAALMLLS